jgi:serine/threonine protein kinase
MVLDTVGRGGMGVVLEAFDSTLNRRVALKLLHDTTDDPEQHARLLREAKALAKLSHPHVVDVYDVGEIGGRVFIAMEFIDGPNLRGWVRQREPDLAAILSVYRDAALGLQAAHDAGIVHRDFKPDNVLIGADGRARVTDFGVALEAGLAPARSIDEDSTSVPAERLTATGMVMGTPAYMPLEQHHGHATDHRSDQFSYCVALYESLYGVRPFTGARASEYCEAIKAGRIPPAPSSVSLPSRVHRAIVRGLSAESEARFPSMRALIRAMTPPTRKRTNWLIAGTVGLGLGATVFSTREADAQPCDAFGTRVEQVYDADIRARIEASFLATEVPLAGAAFAATAAPLDAFAAAWVESATDACLASETGEQSDRMLDLRMHCLDRSLQRFATTVDVFTRADQSEVENASKVASRLPEVGLCSDVDALPQLTVLPETAEQRRDMETLVPLLEQAIALFEANRSAEAQALLDEHRAALEASTYPLVQTLHQTWRGRLLHDQRRPTEARPILEAAHALALRHGLDVEAAHTAMVLGVEYGRAEEIDFAMQWFRSARALARATGSHRIEGAVLLNSSHALATAGRWDEAVTAVYDALELADGDTSFTTQTRVEMQLALASHLFERDGGNAGHEALERARKLASELEDAEYTLAEIEQALCMRGTHQANNEAALAHCGESERLIRRAYGETSTAYAVAMANVAIPLQELGRFDEAIARYSAASEVLARSPHTKRNAAILSINVAELRLVQDQRGEAREELARASTLVADGDLGRGVVGFTLELLWSELLLAEGDTEEAHAHAKTALERVVDHHGPEHHRTAEVLTHLASVELARGELESARTHIEDARRNTDGSPGNRAITSFVYARVLWQSANTKRPDALRLARSAYATLAELPAKTRARNDIRTWLEDHDPEFAPAP